MQTPKNERAILTGGAAFKRQREILGCTQRELAELLEVGLVTIRRIEQSDESPRIVYTLAMEALLARKRALRLNGY